MIGAGIDILLVEGMSGVERRNKLIGRYSSKRRFVIVGTDRTRDTEWSGVIGGDMKTPLVENGLKK
jgi:hypothetical protein